MTEAVKDSVEAALDLNEKEVYAHIAHESAEDIMRIISSLDAERAKVHGEIIYYRDDWDDLIRQRIARGKRHTAFDFYNPSLLDIWEKKVHEAKRIKQTAKAAYGALGAVIIVTLVVSVLTDDAYVLPALALLPLVVFIRGYTRDKLDIIYYELTQFFINELRALMEKHELNPESYKFKLFSRDYFGVSTRKSGTGIYAIIEARGKGGNG
ncbi:hypothetical protein [Thermococcus sp.]|uniref:hypothetical protein n=1 Tax=Thermococcus sp. TaxID=35749 RepID=UPI0025ED0304|nr:hypothetical protein [Thermococcus sp.]